MQQVAKITLYAASFICWLHVQEALLLLHVHNHIDYGSIQGAVVLP